MLNRRRKYRWRCFWVWLILVIDFFPWRHLGFLSSDKRHFWVFILKKKKEKNLNEYVTNHVAISSGRQWLKRGWLCSILVHQQMGVSVIHLTQRVIFLKIKIQQLKAKNHHNYPWCINSKAGGQTHYKNRPRLWINPITIFKTIWF